MLEQLVGIEFKWGGQSVSGCDCLGLANLARELAGLTPIDEFGWIYQNFASVRDLPYSTVEKGLMAINWVPSSDLQDMDVLLMQCRYGIGIGTFWRRGVLWFPGKISAWQAVEDCHKDVLGNFREGV